MRSSALRIALATSLILVVAPAAADEPKDVAQPAPPAAPAPAATPATPDRIAEALAPQPGGLTTNEVARLALRAKPSLRVKEAELKEAAAKVDQALLNFVPRVTGTVTYTRLSEVQNSLGTQTVMGAIDPDNPTSFGAITPGPLLATQCPAPAPAGVNCVRDQSLQVLGIVQVPFNFPVLLNSYSFVAQLAVPISDYVLRISHAYTAATHTRDAKKIELQAAELQTVADAKVAFFNWVLAKGATVVASESVASVDAHLVDMRRIVDAGLASRADLLQLEAQKASIEQFKIAAETATQIAEENLRVTLALPADKPISIGVDVMHEISTSSVSSVTALQEEALGKRLEMRALIENERALGSVVSIARAQYLPRLDAFAQATYANPNQRIFPQKDEFRGTWEAGVRLSWTVNDTLAAPAAVSEAKAKEAQISALKEQLLQGLKLEVASTYAALKQAEAKIEAAERGLVAAEEALRVQTELLKAGRSTSTALIDAERVVLQARMDRVSARVGVLVAKIKLEHALGRDVPSN